MAIAPVTPLNCVGMAEPAEARSERLRLGGMALRNGLVLHGPTHWSAAIRTEDGSIRVASGRNLRVPPLADAPVLRGAARLAATMLAIPQMRRALPEARLAFESPAIVITVVAGAALASGARRTRLSPTTVETLAQAGIASISLKADTTNIQYSDGSAITGQTVFTYTNGTTGTVATANLSYDANGYKVIQTTAVSGSVTTITTTGTHADGSVAYNDVQATAISGNVNTRTLTYDDNVDANGSLRSDGVIDRSQMIVTTTNLDGSTTEAWTNYLGNQAVKQSAVQTTTSADGNTVTILRDDRGGGWFDQSENTLNVAANDNQRNLRWAA